MHCCSDETIENPLLLSQWEETLHHSSQKTAVFIVYMKKISMFLLPLKEKMPMSQATPSLEHWPAFFAARHRL